MALQPKPFLWGICTSQKLAWSKGYRIAGAGQGQLGSISHLPIKTPPCSRWRPRDPPQHLPETRGEIMLFAVKELPPPTPAPHAFQGAMLQWHPHTARWADDPGSPSEGKKCSSFSSATPLKASICRAHLCLHPNRRIETTFLPNLYRQFA